MGPHYFLGLTWPELSAIMGVLVILVTFFVWLTHVVITKPMEVANRGLQRAIDHLSKQVESLGSNAALIHKDLYHRIRSNDIDIARHDEELKTLFNKHHKKGSE